MTKTYLFYDIETTGLSRYFDQVLTFAAIRTDLELNEIARESILVKPRPDVIPTPEAVITHRLAPAMLGKNGVTEYAAARSIHGLVNTPGTTSLGYNSLGFDDEFLRFLFYRNLLDPYSHQYAGGCGRMDLLPITVLFWLFKPEAATWPEISGKPSFRLELLSEANRFEVGGRAHDAMADVEATLELARIFIRHRAVWDYSLEFFDKTRDEERVRAQNQDVDLGGRPYRLCIMISLSFGFEAGYMAPVIFLGNSTTYRNQGLWLRMDQGVGVEERERLDNLDRFLIRRRSGEDRFLLPPAERFWDRLSESQKSGFEQSVCCLREHNDEFDDFVNRHQKFKYPSVPELDPDAALYQEGFFSATEKNDIDRFHNSPHRNKVNVADAMSTPRLRILARRICARNFVETKASKLNESAWLPGPDDDAAPGSAGIGFRNDHRYTRSEAFRDMADLRATRDLDSEQRSLLDELEAYIVTL